MKALVLKSVGSSYNVITDDGQKLECRLKGVFRIRGLKATNPVAVGDAVEVQLAEQDGDHVITRIYERRNYIIRKSTKLSKVVHIIAANMDQAVLVVTMAYPRTSTGFIDRFLVTAEAYKIPVRLVFNKSDLYDADIAQSVNEHVAMYEAIGYPCLQVSALTGAGVAELKVLLRGKTTLFSGHSGVGKSALANAIEPGLALRTDDLSNFSMKGKHTTTFAEMHPLREGGYLIDTPGIKELGLVDFYREELTHYFPEMFALLPQCRFHNCTHTDEPGCAVIDGVERGAVHPLRYQNYLNIYYGRELEEPTY